MPRKPSSPPDESNPECNVLSTSRQIVTETSITESVTASVSDDSPAAGLAGATAAALVGRSEAARMLGVSIATLRRVFEGRLLQAVVDGNGHHRFVVDDLFRARLAYTRKKRPNGAPTPPPASAIDGDLAATVAARLDAGATAIDIVKELRISPDELDPIVRWWRAEHDGIWLSGEQVLELFKIYRSAAALMLPGKHNVAKALEREAPRNAAGVAAMVKVLFDELDARQRLATCKACGRAESEVCVDCYGRQRRRGK